MIDMTAANYDQNKFLNTVTSKLNLKNDAALARALGVAPPVISRIRHCMLPIGATLLLTIHELTDMPVREIKMWANADLARGA